uniref:Uncharacterized protein n=1 Tax=Arundo donax TaxID=35708 RepID=A0A0A9DCQ0_ARUDO
MEATSTTTPSRAPAASQLSTLVPQLATPPSSTMGSRLSPPPPSRFEWSACLAAALLLQPAPSACSLSSAGRPPSSPAPTAANYSLSRREPSSSLDSRALWKRRRKERKWRQRAREWAPLTWL